MCIHPSQVAVANAAFTPSEEEVAEARAVLDALADADRHGQAVTTIGGQMIDPAMGATARVVLGRADRTDQTDRADRADRADGADRAAGNAPTGGL
jgi:citrate lyase beta subunit